MRKNVFGRKFKRDTNERKAFFKGLISSLVLNERIKTTEARAKAIKSDADKIITKVKKDKNLARRSLGALLNKEALEKLINDLAPRFLNRKGGYTRIIRLGKRFGDDAMEVIIEWTEKGSAVALARPSHTEGAAHQPKNKTQSKSRSLSLSRQSSSKKTQSKIKSTSSSPSSGRTRKQTGKIKTKKKK